jgi:hypothetical protein
MAEIKNERQLLLDVLMAARLYLAVKATPKNPFVKGIGQDDVAEQETFDLLGSCVDDASFLFPELEEIEEEKYRKEMSAIDSEQDTFDEKNP